MSLFPNEQISKLIKGLRCPIDNCGLDGTPVMLSGFRAGEEVRERITLTCAYTPNHYRTVYYWAYPSRSSGVSSQSIQAIHETESLVIQTKDHRYQLTKLFNDNEHSYTQITYSKVDGDGNPFEGDPAKKLVIEEDCLQFHPYDQEAILKRLKTLMFYEGS